MVDLFLFSDSGLKTTCLEKQTSTHLERTFLPCFLAITFQHFAIDSQAENLSCDFIVICHCVSPELQLWVSRWQEGREAAAQAALQAVGVSALRCLVLLLRSNWICRLLLLVMMHYFSVKTTSDAEQKKHKSLPQKRSGVIPVRRGLWHFPTEHSDLLWTLWGQNEIGNL